MPAWRWSACWPRRTPGSRPTTGARLAPPGPVHAHRRGPAGPALCHRPRGRQPAWLLRDGARLQLTQDHRLAPAPTLPGPHARRGPRRAAAPGPQPGELHTGDRLLLTSDGIHGVLRTRDIARLLRGRRRQNWTADALAQAALDAGSHDNATALVMDVRAWAASAMPTCWSQSHTLPVPGLLGGAQLDGHPSPPWWPTTACTGCCRRATRRAAGGTQLLHPAAPACARARHAGPRAVAGPAPD